MNKTILKKLDKLKLVNLLLELSKLSKENKAFLETRLNSDFDKLFSLACKKIDKAFASFELMSLKNARKALIDFKKAKPDDSMLIELCLYYIKQAYDLEKTDWRFQENFYSAIEKVYDMIFDLLNKDISLKEKYKLEVEKLIKKSNEGWGHKDYLEERFEEI